MLFRSSGSLGHGLPIGVGMALAAKRSGCTHKVVVLLSDGECDEGSNWEAFLFAAASKLDNLVAIVDYNKMQSYGNVSEVVPLEPFGDKLRAMNWHVSEFDGHDHLEVQSRFNAASLGDGKPIFMIAHTVKGKGVSFMENNNAWHYKSPTHDQYKKALKELGQ